MELNAAFDGEEIFLDDWDPPNNNSLKPISQANIPASSTNSLFPPVVSNVKRRSFDATVGVEGLPPSRPNRTRRKIIISSFAGGVFLIAFACLLLFNVMGKMEPVTGTDGSDTNAMTNTNNDGDPTKKATQMPDPDGKTTKASKVSPVVSTDTRTTQPTAIGGAMITKTGFTVTDLLLGYTVSLVPSGTVSQVPSGTVSQVPSGTVSQVPSSTVSQVPSGSVSQVRSGTVSQVPSGTTAQIDILQTHLITAVITPPSPKTTGKLQPLVTLENPTVTTELPAIDPTELDEVVKTTPLELITTMLAGPTQQMCHPIQQGELRGCYMTNITECGSTCSFFPTRLTSITSNDQLNQMFDMYLIFVNERCHAQATDFLCLYSISACPQGSGNEYIDNLPLDVITFSSSLDSRPLPCRSLCEGIQTSCMSNSMISKEHQLGFSNLCNNLPESSSSDICIQNTNVPVYVTICDSNPCSNGGTCFVIKEERYCRCSSGWGGDNCTEIVMEEPAKSLELSDEMCFRVPEECRTLLRYSSSAGVQISESRVVSQSWNLLSPYTRCNEKAKKMICRLAYPPCETSESETVFGQCEAECNLFRLSCELTWASLSLAQFRCEKMRQVHCDILTENI